MIDANEMVLKMVDVPVDSIVFVSYLAGRPASPRAAQEAARALAEGVNPRHFTGRFKGVSFTKKGDPVMTLWVEERDSASGPGAYRAFNPCLGKLLALEVLQANSATQA